MRASRLIEELRKAEDKVIEQINSHMPGDNVPDRIAIPVLNRLERQQQEAQEAFCAVRQWLESIGD